MPEIGIKLYNNKIKSLGHTDSPRSLETIVTTITDNQDTAEVEFFLITDPPEELIEPLGLVTVRNIPPAKAGEPKIIVQVDFTADDDLDLKVRVNNQLTREVVIPSSHLARPTTTVVKGTKEQAEGTLYDDVELVFSNKPEQKSAKKDNFTSQEETSGGSKKRRTILLLVLIPLALVLILWLINTYVYPGFFSAKPRVAASPPTAPATEAPEPTAPPVTGAPTELPATPQPEATVAVESSGLTAGELANLKSRLERLLPLYFYPDSAELLPDSRQELESVIALLAEVSGQVKITIIGHAAAFDSPASQLEVSRQRALFIQEQLTARGGWDGSLIQTLWKGATAQVYTGQDAERQTQNRRIEILIEGLAESR